MVRSFEPILAKWEPADFRRNLRIIEALYSEAALLGAIPPESRRRILFIDTLPPYCRTKNVDTWAISSRRHRGSAGPWV